MTDEELLAQAPEVLALAEKATPGPWRDCGARQHRCECRLVYSEPVDCPVAQALIKSDAGMCGEGLSLEAGQANAMFIARAREALPAYVSLSLKQAAQIERLSRALDQACAEIRKQTGSCPLDTYETQPNEIPCDDECRGEEAWIAQCWRHYFEGRKPECAEEGGEHAA